MSTVDAAIEGAERVVLARRPVGLPKDTDFRVDQFALQWPVEGRVLLKTVWASIDPYQRSLLSESGAHMPGLPIGSMIVGRTISRVLDSRVSRFRTHDLVLAHSGWSSHAVAEPHTLQILDPAFPPTAVLGVLGVSGMCGYFGIDKLARPAPEETVVVGAAAGPVGSAAGQIARIRGARVVGIVSGEEKVRHLLDDLKFDAAIDRTAADFDAKLAEATPRGVDVYFENVGGSVFRSVAERLNHHARIPVCGVVSTYNQVEPASGPDWTDQFLRMILAKRLRIEGFVQTDFYEALHAEFHRKCTHWLRSNQLVYREDVMHGLANAPGALRRMLSGETIGKVLVKVAHD